MAVQQALLRIWRQRGPLAWLLWPLSLPYRALLALRAQVAGWLPGESLHGTIAQAGLPRTLTPAAALA